MGASPGTLLAGVAVALAGGFFAGWLSRGRLRGGAAEKTRKNAGAEAAPGDSEDQRRRALVRAREEWLATKSKLEQDLRARQGEAQPMQRSLEEREAAQRERDQR